LEFSDNVAKYQEQAAIVCDAELQIVKEMQ
jgi:hypothetical protein